MIEQDTIRLLRECDAGVKMGVAAIDNVLSEVKNEEFRVKLIALKDDHQQLNGVFKSFSADIMMTARIRTRL